MANDIKNVAEKAQADLGLDYAWLDDVTVADWTRYHDLIFGMFYSHIIRFYSLQTFFLL